MKKLIGISGLAGSGKDTVADYLVANHGYVKLSFADTLKDAVALIFDLPRDLLEGDTKESREWRENHVHASGKTPRKILQLFGTEVGRAIDTNVWIKATNKRVHAEWDRGNKVVIPDMRFPNEQEMCNRLGTTWRIERTEIIPQWLANLRARALHTPEAELNMALTEYQDVVHPSEWMMCMPSAMGKMRHLIINDDSLEDLYKYVEDSLLAEEKSQVSFMR